MKATLCCILLNAVLTWFVVCPLAPAPPAPAGPARWWGDRDPFPPLYRLSDPDINIPFRLYEPDDVEQKLYERAIRALDKYLESEGVK